MGLCFDYFFNTVIKFVGYLSFILKKWFLSDEKIIELLRNKNDIYLYCLSSL